MRSFILTLSVLFLVLGCGRDAPFDFTTDAGTGGGAGGGLGGGSGGGVGGGAGGGLGGGAGGGLGGGSGGGLGGGSGGGLGGGAGGGLGGGAGGGAGGGCGALTLEPCRNASACVADFCFVCTCTPRFMGCRAVNAPPAGCPEVACAQPPCCKDDSTCGRPFTCAPPGTTPGCGICTNDPGDCTRDGDCASGRICEPLRCGCTGQRACVEGCGPNRPCATGTRCGATSNRCEPLSCLNASCPANFSCRAGTCERTPCTVDAQCPSGFCVTGRCSLEWGTCQGPVP